MKNEGIDRDKRKWPLVLSAVIGTILIVIGCGLAYYFFNDNRTKNEIEQVSQTAGTLQQTLANLSQKGEEKLISQEQKEQEAIKERLRTGDTEGIKVVFLTFDDGPSEYTDAVLDILKAYNIKGTFFCRGREGEVAEAGYRRIVAEGHTLANHTYNHSYDLYKDPESFYADVALLDDYIKGVTGVAETSHIFRFPGGSLNANKTCVAGILDRGYNYADWNVSSTDAAPVTPDPEVITQRVVEGCHQNDVSTVLCHGEVKENTRTALPQIISTLKGEGYTFLAMEADFTYPRQLEL